MPTFRMPISLLEKLKIGQKLITTEKESWIQDTGTSQSPLTQQLALDLSTGLSACQQARATLEKRISGVELQKQSKARKDAK